MILFYLGYDISPPGGVKNMLDEFDRVVGLHYLRALHLNDSKGMQHSFGLINIERYRDDVFLLAKTRKRVSILVISTCRSMILKSVGF